MVALLQGNEIMNGNNTLSFFRKVKCDEDDHCGPFRMLSLSPFATVAVAILFFSFCSTSFAEKGSLNSFTQASAHQGKDYVALSQDPLTSSNVFCRLIGSYNGTTFTIPIGRDDLPGMAYYPDGLHYGKSSRYVWITSYYRYYSGNYACRSRHQQIHFRGVWSQPPAFTRQQTCGLCRGWGLRSAVCGLRKRFCCISAGATKYGNDFSRQR